MHQIGDTLQVDGNRATLQEVPVTDETGREHIDLGEDRVMGGFVTMRSIVIR